MQIIIQYGQEYVRGRRRKYLTTKCFVVQRSPCRHAFVQYSYDNYHLVYLLYYAGVRTLNRAFTSRYTGVSYSLLSLINSWYG